MFADVWGTQLQIAKKLLNIPLFDDVISRYVKTSIFVII